MRPETILWTTQSAQIETSEFQNAICRLTDTLIAFKVFY